MPEFERLYVKIIGDSNLDKTVDKDSKTLSGFQQKLESLFTKYTGRKVTVDVDEDGATETEAKLGGVKLAADALPDKKTVNVDVDTGKAVAELAAVRAEAVGSGGVVGGLNSVGGAAHGAFAVAIPAAIGVAIAALQPLVGGAAIGGSLVASVTAGFGLMFLAGMSAFGKLEQANGKFVIKTKQDVTKNLTSMTHYLNQVVGNYDKVIQPASNAFAGLAADVLKTVNKTLPAIGRTATSTVQAVHKAVNEVLIDASTGKQVAEYKKFLRGIPGITADLTKAAGNFFLGVVNIISQATPFAKQLSGWISKISDKFLKWTQSNKGREGMQKFFQSAATIAPHIASAVGDIVKKLFQFSGAIMDLFDLDEPTIKKRANKGGTEFVGYFDAALRKHKKQGDGSPAAELGRGAASAIANAFKSYMHKNSKSMFASIWDHIKGEIKGPGGPAALGEQAGKSFREKWTAEFSGKHRFDIIGAIFGKNFAKKVGEQWRKAGGEQNKEIKRTNDNTITSFSQLRNKLKQRGNQIEKDTGQNWSQILRATQTTWGRIAANIIDAVERSHSKSGKTERSMSADAKKNWANILSSSGTLWGKIAALIIRKNTEAKTKSEAQQKALAQSNKKTLAQMLQDSGTIWGKIAAAIIRKSTEAKTKGGEQQKELGKNDKSTWSRLLLDAGAFWGKISATIVKKSTESKEKGGQQQKELGQNDKSTWSRLLSDSGTLWGKIASLIIDKSTDANKKGTAQQQDLEKNDKSVWTQIASIVGPLWSKISGTVIDASSTMVSKVKGFWNDLINFINSILRFVHLDPIGPVGHTSHSSGTGTTTASNPHGPGTGLAKGGLITNGKTIGGEPLKGFARGGTAGKGGLARPRSPRVHLWGEGGYDEGFITTNPTYRKQNLFYLRTIASKLGQVVVPGRAVNTGGDYGGEHRARSTIRSGGPAKFFGGGGLSDNQIKDYKRRGESAMGKPYIYGNIGTYAGPQGYSCSGLWAYILYNRRGNQSYGTYAFNKGTPGMSRGGGQVEVGVELSGGGGHDGTHMAGDIMGTSYESTIGPGVHHGRKAGNFPSVWHLGSPSAAQKGSGGGGGLSITVANPLQKRFDRAWAAHVQSRVDSWIKGLSDEFILYKAAGAATGMAVDKIHDWIDSKIPDTITIGGGGKGGFSGGDAHGSGMDMVVAALKADNLPKDWAHKSSLWNILRQESSSTPQKLNFHPPGQSSGFVAPWEIIIPNRYGVGNNSGTAAKVEVGPRYIKDQYGTPEHAWSFHTSHGWYARGGIIPGPKGRAAMIQAHAGERVLPIDVVKSFDALAHTIRMWASRERAGFDVGNGLDAEDLREEIHKLRKEFVGEVRELRKKTPDAEALLHMALRVQDSPAGFRATERRVGRILNRELARAG